jgi:V/A-type H+-transporting ATPase subunit C
MQLYTSREYLDTRITVLSYRLQPSSWFRQLSTNVPDSIDEIGQQLGLHSQEPKTEGTEPDFESLILGSFLDEFKVLLRPFYSHARSLLLQWISHIELRNLKTILHGALLHRPAGELRESMLQMGDLETLPFNDLLQADDILEMLRILDKTSYSAMARQARRLYEEHNDPFFVNASIDQRYLHDMMLHVNRMPYGDTALLKRLLGFIIDRHNLVWLIRYRFTYGLMSPETWYLLSPGGYYLPSSRIYELINLNSMEKVLDSMPDVIKAIIGERTNLFDIELALENAIEEKTHELMVQKKSMITRTLSWLILREKQLLKVRGILKGQELSLDNATVSFAMGLGES